MNLHSLLHRRNRPSGHSIEALEARIAPAVFTPLAATTDGAVGSLRDAIIAANANGQSDTFDLGAGTYNLGLANIGGQENASATGDLDLVESGTTFTFNGAGVGVTIIDQGAVDRVFQVFQNVTVVFNNLTIRGGEAVDAGATGALPNLGDGNGGGILNTGGIVTVATASLTGNSAVGADAGEGGGGIFNNGGTLTLTGSTISGNLATTGNGNGGGIFTLGGTVDVTGGTISSNQAARAGGGIENSNGTVTLTNTTLNANTASVNGGGLHISGIGSVTINGGTVTNNIAGEEGGGLWNSGGGFLTVRASLVGGTSISNNTAIGDATEQGGGGVFNDGGNVTIASATISNNISTATLVGNGGGGIFNDGTMSLTDTNISNNRATVGVANGGGILNSDGGTLTITGGTISGNQAARAGGGIENLGTVTMTSVTLGSTAANTAGINGGGLHTSGAGSVTINGGLVSGNVAGQEGGGLWNSTTGTLLVQNAAVISQNTANGNGTEQGGGGIFNDGGTVTVANSTVSNNTSTATAVGNGGGGIFNDGVLILTSATITNNTATAGTANGGGILNSDGGTMTATDGSISGNQTARAGGGIENNLGTVTLTGVLLSANTAGINGGGLHTSGAGVVTVSGGTVRDNTAGNEGGGLWNSSSGTLTVGATTVSGNEAVTGGGIFGDGAAGTIAISRSTLSGNSASGNGGGISIEGGALTITNSTLSGNESTTAAGGGLFVLDGTVTISNSTIVANNAAGSGAGGIQQTGGGLTLASSIVANNTLAGVTPADAVNSAGTLNATNSMIETVAVGDVNGTNTGNLFNTDPQLGPLQDNGGATLTHALQIGSLAIDAGANPLNATNDQRGAGFPRVVGSSADMGAVESVVPTLIAVGAGPGAQALVTVINGNTQATIITFLAFGSSYTGGITVATGDVTGDGVPEVIVGRASGDSTVKVFDAFTGVKVDSFVAFDPAFAGGVHLASGDINNDGFDDILVGKGSGASKVKVFSGESGANLITLKPYASGYTGGVSVASGDVNGDGIDDIVTGRAKNSGAQVRVFDGEDGAELATFFAFDSALRNGVFLAVGDVTGDGIAEIIAGAGKGGEPIVHVLNPLTGALLTGAGRDFLAYPVTFAGGVRVAVGDVNGDGIADIITGHGPGIDAEVHIFDGATGTSLDTITIPGAPQGIYVG